MLDDLKLIHMRDSSDAFGVVARQWEQLAWKPCVQNVPLSRVEPPQNIVFVGMGGSAIAALYISSCVSLRVPFEIVHDYTVPHYAGARSLVIISSHSGNTEEVLSALEQAAKVQARVAIITSGGALLSRAQQDPAYQYVVVPHLAQPRYAVFSCLRALWAILETAEVLEADTPAWDELAHKLKQCIVDWLPDQPTKDNVAKQLALECAGKSIVIYSSPALHAAAYSWKIGINENAKQIAWCGTYPEVNHNEILGWIEQPTSRPYEVIELYGRFDHPRTQKQRAIVQRLLSGKRPTAQIVDISADTLLEQAITTSVLGGFVSLYLALLNGLDPAPIAVIDRLKAQLHDAGSSKKND